MKPKKQKIKKGMVVKLKASAAIHCGFQFGQVNQVNDDGSLFVSGRPYLGDSCFVGRTCYSARFWRGA